VIWKYPAATFCNLSFVLGDGSRFELREICQNIMKLYEVYRIAFKNKIKFGIKVCFAK
jgi:hypothetical protein